MAKKRTAKITSKIMSSIRSKNTKVEIVLGKLLRKAKIRFRRHYPIAGTPDFILVEKKIAIFCDGDFWHGNNWKIRGMKNRQEEFDGLSEYWVKKIKTNIKRDRKVNKELKEKGWKVLRIWESDIKKDPEKVLNRIKKM